MAFLEDQSDEEWNNIVNPSSWHVFMPVIYLLWIFLYDFILEVACARNLGIKDHPTLDTFYLSDIITMFAKSESYLLPPLIATLIATILLGGQVWQTLCVEIYSICSPLWTGVYKILWVPLQSFQFRMDVIARAESCANEMYGFILKYLKKGAVTTSDVSEIKIYSFHLAIDGKLERRILTFLVFSILTMNIWSGSSWPRLSESELCYSAVRTLIVGHTP